jgi:PAS domain S-box-containing protein
VATAYLAAACLHGVPARAGYFPSWAVWESRGAMSADAVSAELAEARRRLAELEAAEAERAHAAKVQQALYRIAELASAARDLQDFYREIHAVVAGLMYATNFYLALYDEDRRLISWPYYVDEVDVAAPDPNRWDRFGSGNARGTTAYVLRTGQPQHLSRERMEKLAELGEIDMIGGLAVDWLGVPLKSDEGRTVGVLAVQSYLPNVRYTKQDEELLAFVGRHVGAALSRARAIEETRRRNAELVLINSVQEALAGELELQAIYDAVGDRIRDVFDAQVVDIGIFDETSGLLHFSYAIERGVRFADEPIELIGFRKHVMDTRAPLMLTEATPELAERYGNPWVLSGEPVKSAVFVPLVVGGRATGVLSLQNLDRYHAFTEADQQLLERLAAILSVALENARLVPETRQRNAELELVNSVQDALAGEQELQAIYDVVGDKIRDVFDAQIVDIAIFDETSGLLHFPYTIERGVRFPDEPIELIGYRKHVMETREPLLLDITGPEVGERYGNPYVLAGEPVKSVLFVPLVVGGRATGVISLQNVDRYHAFTESDQQLLETLTASLSVALDNARLVHETRRRNAELALINSVQAAIAGELDPQAIYDLVGDRLQEIFDAQVVDIGIYDEESGLVHFPYTIERGERLPDTPIELIGFRKHAMETREPLMLEDGSAEVAERYGNPTVLVGEPPKSALFVPLVLGGRGTGVISLQNLDRTHAFGEDDQRLLTTLASSLSVALDNARLVHETRQRVAELATVNSVGQALASQLDLEALIELVGEQVRGTFEADLAYVALHDGPSGRIDFAYYYENGRRRDEPSIAYGEGLTSRILRSRAPMLLNQSPQFEEHDAEGVGTPVRSFLGVPILLGETAIGVISVQSIEEEGRFGETESRLLGTIAANVGVAIQNARLFSEVERQRQYLESLVAISPAAVVVMDADERVTEWNPAAAELFGYSAEEALGRPIDDLVFGEAHRDEGAEITREAMRVGRAGRITQRLRKDGTPVDVELMLVPLTADGSHVGFLGIYHDVTELQRARQEAEAATQAKSAFLATMSHEIRTPMNAVIGMTDLLLGTELTGEQREFAEVVRSSGDALLHVIDDILDYSKIEAGKLDLEREPFSVRECVEGALDIVAPRAWEKGIELGCLIEEGTPAGILGDPVRLRQVLLNLLSNAVKFTEAGEVVVLVDAEPTGSGSHRIELSVRDTGIGIAPDRMDRLFMSFSQVDTSTTRRFGGTGLGLAISKRLVDLMGGTISVQSELGSGSTFRIALPAEAAEAPSTVSLDDAVSHLAGRRILVVDDNATNREIVTRHARSWGMEPVAVELPSEALALVEAGEPFDVAVLDMMMPEMDGVTLAEEIRNRRSEHDLPLLLLTSLGRLHQPELAGVFSAQLAKPFKASQLYNTLLRLLTGGDRADQTTEVAEGRQAMSSLRILLAEDNAMNQTVALRLLERLGYRADVASNGLEALAALERQPYDVVLMDVQMPELDGLDASRQIRERWPPESRPHIIALTANALQEDREACFAAGMNAYVAKPIRRDELAEALKRVRPLQKPEAAPKEREIILDAAALQSLRDLGGVEFLAEVIDAFLADAPSLITSLRSSLERHDTEELRRAAHTLKSNGLTLGAAAFAELCRTVERLTKGGRLDGVSELVDQIDQEYQSLQEALASLRSEPVS